MFVLVGYASPHGSTREIAEWIAAKIRDGGSEVDTRSLSEPVDVSPYEAVVLGSAIHNQSWRPEATEFVYSHLSHLTEVPVWLFSVGMARVLGGRWEANASEPKGLPGIREAIHPLDHHLFTGAVHQEHLPLLGRLFYRLMRGRYGDFRDWQEIDSWAGEIASHINAPQ